MECPFAEKIEAMKKEIESLQQELKNAITIGKYWKKEYIEECERQDAWVQRHRLIVENLFSIGPKSAGDKTMSLEDLLLKVYKKLDQKDKKNGRTDKRTKRA